MSRVTAVVRVALRGLGLLLFSMRLDGLVRHLGRRHPKVLLMHAVDRVERDETRGLSVNTTPDRLAENLDWLARHYTFVSLDRIEQGDLPERAVHVTFDDGYRSLYTDALPVLEERGVPATVYLVTAAIDGRSAVWVNELSALLRRHPETAGAACARVTGLPAEADPAAHIGVLQDIYRPELVRGLIDEIVETAEKVQTIEDGDDERLYLSWSEIEEMRERGITFGCHTVSHPSMPGLTAAEAEVEVGSARDEIAARLGSCSSFAYPFGHTDASVEAVALSAGFRSVMEVGGINAPLDTRHVARVAIHDESPAALFAEMELVVPVAARLNSLVGGMRRRLR